MKKIIAKSLILMVSLTLAISCGGNKYIGHYQALTNATIAKLDSVTTVEQYNAAVVDYTSLAEELRAQYSQENFSQAEVDSLKCLTARVAAKFFDIQARLPLAHPELGEIEVED